MRTLGAVLQAALVTATTRLFSSRFSLLAILMLGGFVGSQLLSPSNAFAQVDTWATKTSMLFQHYAGAAGVISGKLYVVGGHDGLTDQGLEVYDPNTDMWTALANPPTAVRHAPGAVVGSKLYVPGGLYGTQLQIYDPSTNTWTFGAPMPNFRVTHAAAVIGTRIYVVGGGAAQVDIYETTTDTWSAGAPIPTPRDWLASAAIGGKIYVVGGEPGGALLDIYDPSTNSWIVGASMPTARCCFVVGVINNQLHAVGGNPPGSPAVTVHEVYDPVTNTWMTKAPMPTARGALVGGAIGSIFYAAGGQLSSGAGTTIVEAYTAAVSTVATNLSVLAASGTYGGTTSLQATLNSNGSGVSGKSIMFTLNSSGVGSAVTNGSGVATLSNVSLSGIDAGVYGAGVSASFAGDSGYGASNASAALTVSKAPLTVTADNKFKEQGDPLPTFTASYSGFVGGEGPEVLAGTLTFSTTPPATATSAPGTYTITPSGLTASNYTTTFAVGTLVITQNDGIDPAIDQDPTGFSNAFSDGTTSGLFQIRHGWIVQTTDLTNPLGVRIEIVGGSGLPSEHVVIDTCPVGNTERITLLGIGETVQITCGAGGSSIIKALATPNIIEVVKNGVMYPVPQGQEITVGSPATASSTNTQPILAQVLNTIDAVIGTFELGPGESVDVVRLTADSIQLTVLVGTIPVTFNGQTTTLNTGATQTFSATDMTPPSISNAAVDKAVLWPPNHKMVDVYVSYHVSDLVDPAPRCSLAVVSNEPINSTGDGDMAPDWEVLDANRLRLRAERAGMGSGRIYTITVTCSDASGNNGSQSVSVSVPKNGSNRLRCDDDRYKNGSNRLRCDDDR